MGGVEWAPRERGGGRIAITVHYAIELNAIDRTLPLSVTKRTVTDVTLLLIIGFCRE